MKINEEMGHSDISKYSFGWHSDGGVSTFLKACTNGYTPLFLPAALAGYEGRCIPVIFAYSNYLLFLVVSSLVI
ncbi:hypothetical protein PsAD37_04868 [Pseudovibrio sp. Ad37]|nr:hypothetical protein PsAD37_04868 [Pseudovibrio sp. Ad37]